MRRTHAGGRQDPTDWNIALLLQVVDYRLRTRLTQMLVVNCIPRFIRIAGYLHGVLFLTFGLLSQVSQVLFVLKRES